MPLLAGASPVGYSGRRRRGYAGEDRDRIPDRLSPLGQAPRFGASPSRMAARSTSGLMPSSTKSRAGFGSLFAALVKAD